MLIFGITQPLVKNPEMIFATIFSLWRIKAEPENTARQIAMLNKIQLSQIKSKKLILVDFTDEGICKGTAAILQQRPLIINEDTISVVMIGTVKIPVTLVIWKQLPGS